MSEERFLEIARECAKAKPQSYYSEPFEPHEWVIDAMKAAVEEFKSCSNESVAWIIKGTETDLDGNFLYEKDIDFYRKDIDGLPVGTKLYAAPQLPSVEAIAKTLYNNGVSHAGDPQWEDLTANDREPELSQANAVFELLK